MEKEHGNANGNALGIIFLEKGFVSKKGVARVECWQHTCPCYPCKILNHEEMRIEKVVFFREFSKVKLPG